MGPGGSLLLGGSLGGLFIGGSTPCLPVSATPLILHCLFTFRPGWKRCQRDGSWRWGRNTLCNAPYPGRLSPSVGVFRKRCLQEA